MPGGRAIRKDGALRTIRHIDQEQPGRAVDAISPLVVEHQELRPFEMRDTVLPEESATHQPFQPMVVPVQDAERIQVPEGDHQITRFGPVAGMFPHLVDEVEMRRVCRADEDFAASARTETRRARRTRRSLRAAALPRR